MPLTSDDELRDCLRKNRKQLEEYCRDKYFASHRDALDLALDAVSRVWEEAFKSRDSFDGSRGTVKVWLEGVADNICNTMLRESTGDPRWNKPAGVFVQTGTCEHCGMPIGGVKGKSGKVRKGQPLNKDKKPHAKTCAAAPEYTPSSVENDEISWTNAISYGGNGTGGEPPTGFVIRRVPPSKYIPPKGLPTTVARGYRETIEEAYYERTHTLTEREQLDERKFGAYMYELGDPPRLAESGEAPSFLYEIPLDYLFFLTLVVNGRKTQEAVRESGINWEAARRYFNRLYEKQKRFFWREDNDWRMILMGSMSGTGRVAPTNTEEKKVKDVMSKLEKEFSEFKRKANKIIFKP